MVDLQQGQCRVVGILGSARRSHEIVITDPSITNWYRHATLARLPATKSLELAVDRDDRIPQNAQRYAPSKSCFLCA